MNLWKESLIISCKRPKSQKRDSIGALIVTITKIRVEVNMTFSAERIFDFVLASNSLCI